MGSTKVLILYTGIPPIDPSGVMGGAQGTTIKRAEYLAQNGYNVTVMMPINRPSYNYNGVEYVNARDWSSIIRNLKELKRQWDVVYCVGSPNLLRESYIIPYIRSSLLRILAFHSWPSPNHHRIKTINRYVDFVICVSKALRQLFAEAGVNTNKILVVYNGVDQHIFHPYPLPRHMKRITFAGALLPKKGFHTLVIAFNMVKKKLKDAELIVCGSADLHYKSEQWLNQLPIPDDGSVQFRGKLPHPELAREFSQAGLAVFPSSKRHCFEGFGKVSIEAQACGCPVVVSDNGGLPETVVDGVTGRVCPADDPKVLADVIIELLSNPDRLKGMGAEAVKHIQKNFLWEQTLKPLKEIIEQRVKVNPLKRQITYAGRLSHLMLEKASARITRKGM